jgi:hypothetical protein
MLKDSKTLIYGGGLFAGCAIAGSIITLSLPSEEAACENPHFICAPLPLHQPDRAASDDEPQLPTAAQLHPQAVASSTISTVQLLARSSIAFRGEGGLSLS